MKHDNRFIVREENHHIFLSGGTCKINYARHTISDLERNLEQPDEKKIVVCE